MSLPFLGCLIFGGATLTKRWSLRAFPCCLSLSRGFSRCVYTVVLAHGRTRSAKPRKRSGISSPASRQRRSRHATHSAWWDPEPLNSDELARFERLKQALRKRVRLPWQRSALALLAIGRARARVIPSGRSWSPARAVVWWPNAELGGLPQAAPGGAVSGLTSSPPLTRLVSRTCPRA